MVLEKRLDYGFNGYQVPAMPRATRSIRRSSFRNKAQGNQQCAFDLLATLAGKILLEGESSPATEKDQCDIYENAANKQQKDEENSEKIELHDPRSFKTSFLGSELGSHTHNQHCSMKEFTCTESNAFPGLSSLITSDCPLKVDCGEKLFIGKSKSEEPAKTRPLNIGKAVDSSGVDPCSAGAPSLLNGKSLAFASSDSSAKIPSCTGQLGIRDDEENYSRCSQPSTTTRKTFMKASHIVDRRIRKLLASKYWKLDPASRNGFLSNIDGQLRPVYLNRKVCYKRLRSQRIYPFKKRKLYNCSQASKSDGRTSSEGIFSSSRKGIHRYSLGSYAAKLGATETSSIGGRRTSRQFRDSHVKLRIKSFKVPELLIDVPETATVGSLKGTVMEAVTAILGGGLRVGVFLKGKKVRDDGRTLLQTGISHDDKLGALGFTLESNPKQGPILLDPEGHPSTPCDPLQPLTRYPPIDGKVHQGVSDLSPDPPITNLGNFIESDHDSAATPAHMPTDKTTAGSQALISVPATTTEELPIVPMHRKSKRSDIVQRRIRRPFSVTEVEALVQSVENLGTGRWRDVKLRAFDNAKHRTYVDLKDKWKTLVHTARISPQQRRGEPVPQELLDRVLTAHSYWSQQKKNC